MTQWPPELEQAINAVVDGDATESQRRVVHAAAGSDPEIATFLQVHGEVNKGIQSSFTPDPEIGVFLGVQREITSSLRESLAPDHAVQAVEHTLQAHLHRSRSRGVWHLPLASAAAILLAIGGFFAGSRANRSTLDLPLTSVSVMYSSIVGRGFVPGWECDAEEFPAKMQVVYGEPLYALAEPAGVDFLGWSYARIPQGLLMGQNTMALLVQVDGAPVIVFIDRADADRTLDPPVEDRLRLFKKDVGDFVLYEVTPFNEPHVLPLIHEG